MIDSESEAMGMCESLFNYNSKMEVKEALEKVHKITGHKSFDKIKRFVKNSNLRNNENFCERMI